MDLIIAQKLFELAKHVTPVANAKIISAVVFRGRIYGIGQNSYKTHPIAKKFHDNPQKQCLHAEMDACIKALYNLSEDDIKKATIYVLRSKKNFTPGLAKPCKACENFIKSLGIIKVAYSLNHHIQLDLIGDEWDWFIEEIYE